MTNLEAFAWTNGNMILTLRRHVWKLRAVLATYGYQARVRPEIHDNEGSEALSFLSRPDTESHALDLNLRVLLTWFLITRHGP